jgi:hypothetical protein
MSDLNWPRLLELFLMRKTLAQVGAPFRKVVSTDGIFDELECGHTFMRPIGYSERPGRHRVLKGQRSAMRRRCIGCVPARAAEQKP